MVRGFRREEKEEKGKTELNGETMGIRGERHGRRAEQGGKERANRMK